MVTQFQGETNWDAAINSAGLDIEEEDEFRDYLRRHGYLVGDDYHINPDIPLPDIGSLIEMWQKEA